MQQTTLLPHGPYQATLLSRRTLAIVGNPPTPASLCIELTVTISAGPYATRPVAFKVFGAAKVHRAKALIQGQALRIHITQHALDSGRLVNRVVGFEPLGKPTAVELLQEENTAEVMADRLPEVSAAALSSNLPDVLLEKLRAVLAGMTKSKLVVAEENGPLATRGPAPDWAAWYSQGFWSKRKKGFRTIVPYDDFLLLLSLADQAIPDLAQSEGYLSVFQYNHDLAAYRDASNERSIAGFRGPAWTRWLAVDLDGDGSPGSLDRTLLDARRLVEALVSLGLSEGQVLIFFSGNRGVHVLFPSMAFGAQPMTGFERAAGVVCTAFAALVGVTIDTSLYDRLKPLRAPNTQHDATGLYKVLIRHDELPDITSDAVRKLASEPRPFELPSWQATPVPILVDLWAWACQSKTASARPSNGADCQKKAWGEQKVFASTLDLMVHGAAEGSRGKRFFQASMNLLDFGCPEGLLIALLEHAATLSNYPPTEFMSQIQGAIKAHARSPHCKTT